MAKISPVSIKYMVYASFKAEGPLEKPDVIGAIFGQTEGLLGAELEMRELQKEGKIGRIEVDLETVDGKSVGQIKLPSALDKSETTIIAAALETIDRIGPTEAHIEVTKIEDVRGSKRDFIIERAKKLLEGLEEGGDISDMSKTVKEEARAAKIQEYGDEKLPAGDLSDSEVVVVEGRADVVNLLRNRVNNVIGMNGTKLPAEIAKLGEQKSLTLFIDGDRGGKLIAQNVINNAKIAYVAIAPDGKEVEELQGKEILMSLRKKIPTSEFLRKMQFNRYEYNNGNGNSYGNKEMSNESSFPVAVDNTQKFVGEVKDVMKKAYDKIKGSRSALLVDNNFDIIKSVAAREVTRNILNSRRPIFAVVIDGTAMSTTIKACDEKGIPHLGATTFSSAEEAKVNLISL